MFMKKFTFVVLTFFLVFAIQLTAFAAPAKKSKNIYTPANVTIMYNHEPLQLKKKPVRYKEFVLVPAKEFYQSFGAEVKWDAGAQMLAINTDTDNTLFFKNQKSVIINGIQYPMVTPAVIVNGTFMVEITSAAAALNYGVYTEGNTIYLEPLETEENIEDDSDIQDNAPTEEEYEQERIKRAYEIGI
jgi:hypothetical protein